MSSKPVISLARWADQIGANLISPTSGERDLGFGSGTPASAGKVNWQINQLYQWALYLNDGDVALHNVTANDVQTATLETSGAATVGGALAVTGASTLAGALNANAAATIGPFHDFNVDGSTGTVTIHSQLFMAGTATFAGTNRLQSSAVAAPPTGNNNNYALPTQPVLSLTGTTGSPVITGMVAVGDGHIITIVNNGSASIQFTHQDTNSTAGNRFQLPGAATLTLAQHGIVTFMYGTGAFGAWRVLSKNF